MVIFSGVLRNKISFLLASLCILCSCQMASLAVDGHSINDIDLTKSPNNVEAGDTINRLSVKFRLESNTGIQVERIRVSLDDKLLSSANNPDEFTLVNDPDDSKFADINFVKENVETVSGAENRIKIEYLLTSTSDIVLAKRSKSLNLKGSADDDENNNNNNNGNETQEKTVIIKVSVEDTSEDKGVVSLTPKTFDITIDSNPEFFQGDKADSFDPINSFILRTLIIESRDLKGNKTKIKDDLEITLKEETAPSPDSIDLDRTIYSFTLNDSTKAQTIIVRLINIENFFESLNVTLPENSVIKGKFNVEVKPIEFKLSNFELNNADNILFLPRTNGKVGKKNPLVMSTDEEFTLTADFSPTETLSTEISSLVFVEEVEVSDAKNKFVPPQIKFGPKAKDKLNFNVVSDATNYGIEDLGNNVFKLSLPHRFEIGTQNRNILLRKNALITEPNSLKGFEMPVGILTKTESGLDVLLSGKFGGQAAFKILDEPRFLKNANANLAKVIEKEGSSDLVLKIFHSNTVPGAIDLVELEIRLLANNQVIDGPVSFTNLSPIKKKHFKKFKGSVISELGAEFAGNLSEADTVDIRLKRNQAYLESLGLDEDPVGTADIDETATSAEGNEDLGRQIFIPIRK